MVADVQCGAAATCVDYMLDTSSPGNGNASSTEEVRLITRIRETGRRDRIPEEAIKILIGMFSDDVDVRRLAQPGDGFRIYYRETTDGATEVLFVSMTYGCETRTFYRFVDADGVAGYYDQKGRSTRRKLLRNPVEAGLLVGRFGYREPVPSSPPTFHHGIDLRAPHAAPVHAAGDGIVEEMRLTSDDQWLVRLRHDEAYQTRYLVAAPAFGIEPGQRVRQGQVIGFSDAQIDATVHYEILVNDRFFDPMRIRLPAKKELRGQEFADFQDEVSKIATLAEREAPFHSIEASPAK